jgi:hypothetical protein
MNDAIGWAAIAAVISGLVSYAAGRSAGFRAGYFEGRHDTVRGWLRIWDGEGEELSTKRTKGTKGGIRGDEWGP